MGTCPQCGSIVRLTTEANDQSSLHCITVSTDVMSDHNGPRDASHRGVHVTRDAILMCDQKPTYVRLIYHTEPKTKKRKLEELQSKNRHAQK